MVKLFKFHEYYKIDNVINADTKNEHTNLLRSIGNE
jgi:hypothetical protein